MLSWQKKEFKQVKEKEKPTQPKIDEANYIKVDSYAEWLRTSYSALFYDTDLLRILQLFVLHSPCRVSSYSPKTLAELGWKDSIWSSEYFREAFYEITGLDNDKFQQKDATSNFKDLWESAGYGEDFFAVEDKEFAFFIVAGEANPMMNMLHHIRNSFAHGRFCVKKRNHEEYIYFEDVTGIKNLNGLYVNSRICLKKKALIALIDFLEKKDERAKKLTSIFIEEK